MSAYPPCDLHVLHVTAPAQFGGLESVVEGLCSGLVERGIRTTVIVVLEREQPDHPFVVALRKAGSEVVPVVVGARAYWREGRILSRLIEESAADIVHTHGYRSDVIGGLVGRLASLPLVSTLHGFTASTATGRRIEWLQLRSLRRFGAVIGVSAGITARVAKSGVTSDRIHLIPNASGRRIPPFDRSTARGTLGLPDDAFVVGWVGRLSHEKGADVFLESLALLPDRTGLVVSIIGEGRERTVLEARARELGLEKIVRWHGIHRDAGRLMAAFDVFVLSSRTEGVPMVLLEAMKAGTPIVATAVGGVPAVIDDTQGTLVPTESPAELAAALHDVRVNRDAAVSRAARAGERLDEQFAVGPWIDSHIGLYEALRRR